jgi:hypothetical protein
VNKLDSSEFLLRLEIGDEYFAQICKVVGTRFVVGDAIEVPFNFQSYLNGRLYGLSWLNDMVR